MTTAPSQPLPFGARLCALTDEPAASKRNKPTQLAIIIEHCGRRRTGRMTKTTTTIATNNMQIQNCDNRGIDTLSDDEHRNFKVDVGAGHDEVDQCNDIVMAICRTGNVIVGVVNDEMDAHEASIDSKRR